MKHITISIAAMLADQLSAENQALRSKLKDQEDKTQTARLEVQTMRERVKRQFHLLQERTAEIEQLRKDMQKHSDAQRAEIQLLRDALELRNMHKEATETVKQFCGIPQGGEGVQMQKGFGPFDIKMDESKSVEAPCYAPGYAPKEEPKNMCSSQEAYDKAEQGLRITVSPEAMRKLLSGQSATNNIVIGG